MEIANNYKFIGGSDEIKLCQDRLEVLKIECPVLDFFQIVLKISLKLILDIVNKSLENFKVIFKEGFKVKSHNKTGALVAVFVLSPSKADGTTES